MTEEDALFRKATQTIRRISDEAKARDIPIAGVVLNPRLYPVTVPPRVFGLAIFYSPAVPDAAAIYTMPSRAMVDPSASLDLTKFSLSERRDIINYAEEEG
jgi:hypothetical protein